MQTEACATSGGGVWPSSGGGSGPNQRRWRRKDEQQGARKDRGSGAHDQWRCGTDNGGAGLSDRQAAVGIQLAAARRWFDQKRARGVQPAAAARLPRRRRGCLGGGSSLARAATVRRRLTSSGGGAAVVVEGLHGCGGLAVKMGLEVKWVWRGENGFGGR
ncbi:hypothetical protein Syun_028250 [Stephania yunnanensis]|uniref:Uncharacterized protein n=1 Tax=Stephania yunnanensis TaxID=152371 RepID=A0AAP0EQY3_9MAGN